MACKDKEGRTLNEEIDIRKRRREYFENLLSTKEEKEEQNEVDMDDAIV